MVPAKKEARSLPSRADLRKDKKSKKLPFIPGKVFAKPLPLALLYIFTGTILQWSYGLSSNLIQANASALSYVYHATSLEMAWLTAAYMAPNVSLSIILIKLRTQFGLRIFGQLSMVLFFFGTLVNSFVLDFQTALFVRFLCGIVASPISSLAFLYVIEAFRIEKKFTIALSFNLMNTSLAVPLARMVSPLLLKYFGVDALYYWEIGMIFIGFVLIFALPLTLAPTQKVLEFFDFYSYTLIAIGLGLNAIIMSVGLYYGWGDADWIGNCFILAIICITGAGLIELNRQNPLINLRWVFSRDMLHIAFVLFMFRLLLSEQSSVVANFFSIFGLHDEHLGLVYAFIGLGVITGGGLCIFFYRPGREDLFHIIALILLAIGAYIDSHLGYRADFFRIYISQFLLGCGGAMFMPPSMSKGFAKALISGQKYVSSFIAVFLVTQSTGGLVGAAFFNNLAQTYENNFYQKLVPEDITQTPYFQANIAAKMEACQKFILDKAICTAQAERILSQNIKIKANIMAYMRVFKLYFYIALSVLFFLLGKIIYQYIKYKQLKTVQMRARVRRAKAIRKAIQKSLKNFSQQKQKSDNMPYG